MAKKKKDQKKIIIVDKKASRRDALASRFRLQGYTIDSSNSGFQTLSFVEKEAYDTLIILDDAQDMGANELICLIRAAISREELQIIFSDKKKDQQQILELLNLGISEYIVYSDKVFGSLVDKIEAFNSVKKPGPKSIFS